MTPKEKAKELVDKFEVLLSPDIDNYNCTECVECALIAVDEIIKSNPEAPNNQEPFSKKIQSIRQNFIDAYNYWQEVKQEIEKL